MELSILIITKVNNGGLLIGYKFVKNEILYNETWNEIAKLLISNKVKENKIKDNGINENIKINSNKVEKSQM